MIRIIDVKRLRRFLSHEGPYIYYFNSLSGGKNYQIVERMTYYSKKYPILNFLEVLFIIGKNHKLKITESDMNKIYLYYQGKKIEEYFEPTEDEINYIINQCIIIQNKKLESLSENVGSGRKRKTDEPKNMFLLSDIKIKKYDKSEICRMKTILRKRIDIPKIDNINKYSRLLEKKKYTHIANKNENNSKISNSKNELSNKWKANVLAFKNNLIQKSNQSLEKYDQSLNLEPNLNIYPLTQRDSFMNNLTKKSTLNINKTLKNEYSSMFHQFMHNYDINSKCISSIENHLNKCDVVYKTQKLYNIEPFEDLQFYYILNEHEDDK